MKEIDDVMVKDQCCGVYFPKRECIETTINGQIMYFCSTECRDKFIEKSKQKMKA
ncbi:hypothetical protein GMMP15_1490006 [Candidatus Magnetomoraceae bacterium gMMP-15]